MTTTDPITEAITEDEKHRECVSALDCHIAPKGLAVSPTEYECMRVQYRRPILAALTETLATERKERSRAEGLRFDVDEILERAYKFDDKPHRLFSAIRALALRREDDVSVRDEIARLMDAEYERQPRDVIESQLATARTGLERIGQLHDCNDPRCPSPHHVGPQMARETLAAITPKDDSC